MHSHEQDARLERIREAHRQYRESRETVIAAHHAGAAQHLDFPTEWRELKTGDVFVSQGEIRVMPKVNPTNRAQALSAIAQSRVFIPGVPFRVLGASQHKKKGATKKTWYRVEALGSEGESLFRGFVIDAAIQGPQVQTVTN